MASQTPKTVHLKATYTSPTQPEGQSISSIPLSLPTSQSSQSLADKTTYLASLRAATIATQETVNAALTARMEEDIARNALDKAAAGGEKKKVDEVAEEENYGEEDPEDDE
ncbi:hypothetical protein FHL15_008068 [Xylaria flabelliformis]|uniref:EKC/KEOPS complex subunit GON7 n=1 Tax=Xylaria flabelliformis TaxID=2512241 RepID=A0A553HSZ4_9PEZI|nr:hypothetical protein FHL15_008068 [Xylaria flabelliformis]